MTAKELKRARAARGSSPRGSTARRSKAVLGVVALIALAGCGGSPEPLQSVNFAERLNIEISQRWVPTEAVGKQTAYKLAESDDVSLSFEDQTSDYGTPMTVQSARAVIGSELNLTYGNVDARVSFGGNALLTYPRIFEEGSSLVYTRSWVVAKPFGYGGVTRVAITLRMPEGRQTTPEIQMLIEQLDKQVGDAVIPAA